MKKILFSVSALAILFASCQKAEAPVNTNTKHQVSGNDPSVTMQGGASMREFLLNEEECQPRAVNCAPTDIIVEDHEWLWWWDDCEGHGGVHIGPIYIEWSSETPNAPIFRTPKYNGGFLSQFKDMGINTQTQLDKLDNATFYAVLFPGLTSTQRSMLYSGTYNTAIGYNKQADKFFIFVATKDRPLAKVCEQPLLVIPFIVAR